jgi:hypothetical protein
MEIYWRQATVVRSRQKKARILAGYFISVSAHEKPDAHTKRPTGAIEFRPDA